MCWPVVFQSHLKVLLRSEEAMRIIVISKRAHNQWQYDGGTDIIRVEESTPGDRLAAFTVHLVDEPVSLTHALIGLHLDAKRTAIVFLPALAAHNFSHEVVPLLRKEFPDANLFFDVVEAAHWLLHQKTTAHAPAESAV